MHKNCPSTNELTLFAQGRLACNEFEAVAYHVMTCESCGRIIDSHREDRDELTRVLRTMRAQAWERAKGELNSTLHTFWERDDDKQYDELSKEINEFIGAIEGRGLME